MGADPVYFVASGAQPGLPANTSLAGIVLTNENEPISGVTVTIAGTGPDTFTDADGQFLLLGAPPGPIHLEVDGSTTGPYPSLEFELDLIPGAVNDMGRPIYLPLVDALGIAVANPDTDVIIERPDLPGFQMTIPAGSATFPEDVKTGQVQVISVNRDKIPMPPSDGSLPRWVIAIKPADVVFDPPAPFRFPNVDGRDPGAVVPMWSFDHDVGQFVVVATGQVTEDGAFVLSEPGQGFVKGGWHINPDPSPPTTCTQQQGKCKIERVECDIINFAGGCGTNPACPKPVNCVEVITAGPDSDCYCPQTPIDWKVNLDCFEEIRINNAVVPDASECLRNGTQQGCCRDDAGLMICCPTGQWCDCEQRCHVSVAACQAHCNGGVCNGSCL